jgi:hypothetical protein
MMSHERFNELLAGPLHHPLPHFIVSRLVLALKHVVDATGDAGEKALEEYCAAREGEPHGEMVDDGDGDPFINGAADITPLPTDRVFDDSPDAGHPDCLCSRCGNLIDEKTLAIRAWPEGGKEYRYHPACVGLGQVPHEEVESEPEDLP